MIAYALAALLLQADPPAAAPAEPKPAASRSQTPAPSAYQRREGKATHLPGGSGAEAASAATARTAGSTVREGTAAAPTPKTDGATVQISPTGRPYKPSAYQRREGKAGHGAGAPQPDVTPPPAAQK